MSSLSLTPQGTLSNFDGSKTAKSYQLAASASWEIDIFGKLTNAKRDAKAALAQAFYATNEARAYFYPNITLSGVAGWTNSGRGSFK